MGVIYRLVFPSGKCYVGQTTRPLHKRMLEHQKSQNNSWLLARAIKKYSWHNVKTECLVELPNTLLDSYEQRFIDLYGCVRPGGYNLTKGGDENPMNTVSGRKRQLEAVQTDAHRKARGQESRSWHQDPAKHEAWKMKNALAQQQEETRKKQGKITASNWKVPEIRNKRVKGLTAAFSKPETAAKRARAAAKALRTDEVRANLTAARMKKREELLAKLPPEEREKKRAILEKQAKAARQWYQRKHGLSLT